MKAPAFDYIKPQSLDAALALLAQHGDEARLLAGGQTLLATLNLRLSEPSLLIDLNGLPALKGISLEGHTLRIGARTTHSEIEASALVAKHCPLLSQAVPHIAHRAIRNLGTLGGSLAYADSAAEWPACLLALNGTVVARSQQGERRIAADQFFTGLYSTALNKNELITAVEFPTQQSQQRHAFIELARRHGDYAVVGLAASASLQNQRLSAVRLAWFGLVDTPWRSQQAEQALQGQAPDEALIQQAVNALRAEAQPRADLTHSAETKRHLAGVLLARALRTWSSQ
jgi:aerobic carbon-monoxide dehydrogenase medium subunit